MRIWPVRSNQPPALGDPLVRESLLAPRPRPRFLNAQFSILSCLLAALWPVLTSCTGDGTAPLLPLPPNFHTVDSGMVYRSGQPTGPQIQAVVDRFAVRTVVNLRGTNTGRAWYDEAAAACAAAGVRLVDHRMSAQSLPSAELLGEVIETLLTAEYPILLHCSGGSDRTGAVSAIYRMLILDHPRPDAMAELSPFFLHFRQFMPCMSRLAELYEPRPEWLAEYAAMHDELTCIP